MQPKAGDLLLITERASVQFIACEPFMFAVIKQHDWKTYTEGWIWLDGYQLDAAGIAKERRSIFVQLAGLIYIRQPPSRSRTRHRSTAHYPNTRPNIGRIRPRTYSDVEPDRP